MSTFNEKFTLLRDERKSLLCVGLDPDLNKIPSGYRTDAVYEFLKDIIDATHSLTAAYKPNLAFFEAMGSEGWAILQSLIQYIRKNTSNPLIIADAKRGDIGNTAEKYAKAFFEILDCDAVTLSPYMGMDTIEPFTEYRDKGSIVLCLTSNRGAEDFELQGNPPLYERVAREAVKLNQKTGNVWLVVGATRDSESVKKIKSITENIPFLIPGIGAQGGDLETILKITGKNCLINSSRNILYSAEKKDQVKSCAEKEAENLIKQIRSCISFDA